jgi:hypothetical protein
MALCKNGFKEAKAILAKLTPELDDIITKVLNVTGAIMTSQAWEIIEPLLMQLPAGSAVINGVIIGVNALTEVDAIIKEPDWKKKLQLFIAYISLLPELNQHAKLIKFASVLSAALHGNKESESVYDTLTQAKSVAA